MQTQPNLGQEIQRIKTEIQNEERELLIKEKKYTDNDKAIKDKKIEIINLQKSHDAMRMEIMNLERIQPALKSEIDHLKKEVASHKQALTQNK